MKCPPPSGKICGGRPNSLRGIGDSVLGGSGGDSGVALSPEAGLGSGAGVAAGFSDGSDSDGVSVVGRVSSGLELPSLGRGAGTGMRPCNVNMTFKTKLVS